MPLGGTASAADTNPSFHGTVGQGGALGTQKVLCKEEEDTSPNHTVWQYLWEVALRILPVGDVMMSMFNPLLPQAVCSFGVIYAIRTKQG